MTYDLFPCQGKDGGLFPARERMEAWLKITDALFILMVIRDSRCALLGCGLF